MVIERKSANEEAEHKQDGKRKILFHCRQGIE